MANKAIDIEIDIQALFEATYLAIRDLEAEGIHPGRIKVITNDRTWGLITDTLRIYYRDFRFIPEAEDSHFALFGTEFWKDDYFPNKDILITFKDAGWNPEVQPKWIELQSVCKKYVEKNIDPKDK